MTKVLINLILYIIIFDLLDKNEKKSSDCLMIFLAIIFLITINNLI